VILDPLPEGCDLVGFPLQGCGWVGEGGVLVFGEVCAGEEGEFCDGEAVGSWQKF